MQKIVESMNVNIFTFYQEENSIPIFLTDHRPGVSPPEDDQEDGYNTKTLFQGDIKVPERKTRETIEFGQYTLAKCCHSLCF